MLSGDFQQEGGSGRSQEMVLEKDQGQGERE